MKEEVKRSMLVGLVDGLIGLVAIGSMILLVVAGFLSLMDLVKTPAAPSVQVKYAGGEQSVIGWSNGQVDYYVSPKGNEVSVRKQAVTPE